MNSEHSVIIDKCSRGQHGLTALRGCVTITTGTGGAALQCQRISAAPRFLITKRTSI